MVLIERSLQEIGKSLLVTIPKGYTRALKLHKGSKVRMAISERGVLTIMPGEIEQKSPAQSSITYDASFPRRFIKEYFEGNDTISITFPASVLADERRSVNAFLKKFMNAQVIEESSARMVVRCFRIEELSIEECLRRMHYLVLGIFDELLAHKQHVALVEMDEPVTQFYYMLVMQVRRFLNEGKYAEQNQITLIRAMDYRMVAEKIERVGGAVKDFGEVTDDVMRTHLREAREFYARALQCFFARSFDDALALLLEQAEAMLALDRELALRLRKNDAHGCLQISFLMLIRRLARDATMLVR